MDTQETRILRSACRLWRGSQLLAATAAFAHAVSLGFLTEGQGFLQLAVTIRFFTGILTLLGLLTALGTYPDMRPAVIRLDAVGSCCLLFLAPLGALFATVNPAMMSLLLIVGSTGVACHVLIAILAIGLGLVRGPEAVGLSAARIRGASLHDALAERGYTWLSPTQARELWALCGEAAFRLPPWEEVGILPGVTEGDIGSLAALARKDLS